MTDPTPPTVPVPMPVPATPPSEQGARRAEAEPPLRSDPPPGGPADPADRTVTPIAHPPVTLPPNPPADATVQAVVDAPPDAIVQPAVDPPTDAAADAAVDPTAGAASPDPAMQPIPDPAAPVPQRRLGLREIIIGALGIVALVSAFLPWQHLPGANAWTTGMWVGPVLGLLGAAVHLFRYLPPADKAFGALLPLLLATGAVWVPVAHLYDNVRTAGTWVCLAAGLLLVGALLGAAMTDPALRSPDNPDDVFD